MSPTPAEAAPDDTEPRPGPPVGVIVGIVIVGAALLVVAALGTPFLLQQLRSGGTSAFTIGDCVVRDGSQGVATDCGTPGAFEIISTAADESECPDPTQPTVSYQGTTFCLAPVGAAPAATEQPDQPSTAEPTP